ncbi:MAG: LysM peptidoglycan-binding domain-containing protein, partial [Proteobacteria bacterium]|nr:LysM peptidoglycan-binding domain-containing protein [Pseudomonadota bacterium]
MRRANLLLIGVASLWLANPALAAPPDHTVERGDTLWDLSARFWNDPRTWPELWSLNPQFRNPHIIAPGDPIFLHRGQPEAGAGAEERVVRLRLERLEPPGAGTAAATPAPAPEKAATDVMGREAGPKKVFLPRGKGLDFISPTPVARLGTVDNRHQVKVAYATGEDVEFALAPGVSLRPGDRVTLVDDRTEVRHPLT